MSAGEVSDANGGGGGRRRVPVDEEEPAAGKPVDTVETRKSRVRRSADDSSKDKMPVQPDAAPPTVKVTDDSAGHDGDGLMRGDSYIIAVGGTPGQGVSDQKKGASVADKDRANDASEVSGDGNGVPQGGGKGAPAATGAAAGTAAVAAAGGSGGGGGNGGGNGKNGKAGKEPSFTPPPEDALIRGWGLSDWAKFANVSTWSARRWKVQLMYWKKWFWEHRWEIYQDCLIGFAVALAQIPEAIAFAFVAGMPPIVGLYGTIVLGFVTSLLGGRPGMVSGTSGAVGVVQAKLVSDFNGMSAEEQLDTFGTNNVAEVIFATLLLMGGVEIMLGVLQISRVIDLMGTPVMIGFVNGLAMLIGRSQMSNFKRFNNETYASDDPFVYEDRDASFIEGIELGYTLLLVFSAMATMVGVPVIFDYFTNLDASNTCLKTVKRVVNAMSTVPPTLYAILVALAIDQAGGLDTLTVENKAIVKGEFISWHVPDVTWSTKLVNEVIGHAFIWAVVSMTEGVMTLTLLSEMIGNEGYPNQDMVAQGLGNIACGLLRGQGGDAMIGQSIINVKSGGVRRRSGALASVFIMIFVVVAYDFINIIPLGGLAGVMFIVVIFTFEWNTFRLFLQIPIVDSIVIVVVTLVTYFMSDLSIGVACGIAISCLYYAYTSGQRLSARTEILEDHDEDGTMFHVKIYHLDGNLFFGSLRTLQKLMTPETDPEVVVLHLQNAKTFDMSAAQGLSDVTDRYNALGKDLRVAGLSPRDAQAMAKIHHVTKSLTVDDYDRSVGDHHFERQREIRRERPGVFGRIFGPRVSVFNPEGADVGQASTLPNSWDAPHHKAD